MRGLVIYGSSTGNTAKAAARLVEQLNFSVDVVEVKLVSDVNVLGQYDVLIFMASTWGDGELQVDMEAFFVRQQVALDGRPYAICEVGNYYGYDDFDFGALRVMEHYLKLWGGREIVEPFSLDSLPRMDWGNFERWCDAVNDAVMELA